MHYVYSTLGQDMCYTAWIPTHDLHQVEHTIVVKGGTGVIDKNLVTKNGVRTEINEKDYEFLKENEVFKMHVKNKYITVESKKYKTESVVKDLQPRDNSSQLTTKDFHDKSDTRFTEAGIKAADIQKKGK
jgi:hypothetical protein